MIKSMTGFGKAECECQSRKIVIEIKSLNSKQLDINARIPNGYREKEVEIRNLISSKLKRGKVDFQLSIDNVGDVSNFSINKDLARKYYRELKELSGDFEEKDFSDYLTVVMRLPDVLVPEKDEIGEQEWKLLIETIKNAIDKVDEFRIEEGKSLEKDVKYRNENILNLLLEIDPFEKERLKNLQQKIKKDIYEIANKEDIDKNRFEQELVYYQDKLDITEEKVRLKKHCEYFLETINEKGAQGKKLIFISQEMGREINTLGSKASHANIQRIVVRMKDELEKIKEQLFNIL
ncbi:MAG: YicC family protein [Bacteroidales bacterium]|nr:YicC family protein [Bacteroidales bacterium]